MLIQKDALQVRYLEEKDKPLLANWLSNPNVLQFYEGRDQPFDLEQVNKVFYGNDREGRCMVEFGGKEIGYIQFYTLDDITKATYGYNDQIIYGIDQFIGEEDYWNKGIGKLLVTSMARYLIKQKSAERVVMDPQIRNQRAIRCYEKSGFIKVKKLPKHELHEGEYQDCWLMEYGNVL
ncbi:acetyltransferase [Aquibacillus koreensis]|uniref:Acetyltransferase n=1 Tax=Aquibacillus koreensis TaxID=279446 RepID=A0A9X4AJN0_9BACI|nr:acetyltransferase [Aquibacillus koreensis]MCT2536879.1 acetyltransferase [Aquibacillus koreensis]MDC3421989.1 acetyltransferase [Aquibacillus koreensis]